MHVHKGEYLPYKSFIRESTIMSFAMKLLITPLLFLLPLFALAHEHDDHYDRVHLSASAETRVENDIVLATLYAQEEGADATQLADLVNERIGKALQLVNRYDAIKAWTGSYNTSPVYHNNKITGWRVRQNIQLESRDMKLVSTALGELQQTLSLQEITFAVSPELKNSTDELLIAEALKVFEQRASNITGYLGRKNYKIVEINVSHAGNRHPKRNYEFAAMASDVAPPSIVAGEQTLQVTVNGQIELD
jgi:predicted secreted protein